VIPKVFSEASSVEAAAKQYTSEWQATRVVRVQWGGTPVPYNIGSGGGCVDPIVYVIQASTMGRCAGGQNNLSDPLAGRSLAIGVAEWQVKGQVPTNNTYFKEEWAMPGSKNLDFRLESTDSALTTGSPETGYFKKQKVSIEPSAVSVNDFLVSVSDPAIGVRFITAAVPRGFATSGTVPSNTNAFCGGNGSGGAFGYFCATPTGSYGWVRQALERDLNGVSDFTNRYSANRGSGSFIPLKWTVTGYVCDKPTDVECR
jgi:hypothetical protein